jgi:hypothetical protein
MVTVICPNGRETDFSTGAEAGQRAEWGHICFSKKHHSFVTGPVVTESDKDRIDRSVEAWSPKTDRMVCQNNVAGF